jgi:hypothetical protein
MRRHFQHLVIAALALFPVGASGQAPAALARMYRLDFAIPDAPAFELLEVDPSTILRPTTVRELGLAVSDFAGDGSALTIPKAFALEVAPALIIGGPKLTTEAYRARLWLYRFRVSVATRQAEPGDRPTALALGLRASLVDRADLRTLPDSLWRQPLTAGAKILLHASQELQDTLVLLGLDPEGAASLADSVTQGADRRKWPTIENMPSDSIIFALVDSVLAPSSLEELQKIEPRLQERRGKLQESLWNAFAIDAAFGISANGTDADGEDLRVEQYGVWLSLSAPVTRHGQLLLGAREGGQRDSLTAEMRFAGTINGRLYLGRNYAKFFVEGQSKLMDDRSPVFLLNSGGEIRPPFGGWVTLSAGIEFNRNTRSNDLVTNFAYKFGFPSLF